MNAFLARAIDDVYSGILTLVRKSKTRHFPQSRNFDFYRRQEFLEVPELFYPRPKVAPKVCKYLLYSTSAFECYNYTFKSQYCPLTEEYSTQYRNYTECHTVYGRYYRLNRNQKTSTIIYLHGWMECNVKLHERLIFNLICRDLGFDLISMVHPFHMQRAPQKSFSGEYFLSGDIIRTIEACRQAVTDVMSIINWLEERGSGRVGVMGFSLGGFITGLLISSESRLDFAIPSQSHGCVSEVLWCTTLLRHVRKDILTYGIGYEELKELCQVISPKNFKPKIPKESILMINGLYDAIVRREEAMVLWRKWSKPQIIWYPAGHMTFYIYVGRVFQKVKEFLQ